MTDAERNMILHALGLRPMPTARGKMAMRRWSYRNYVAGCDTQCQPLVEKGLMILGDRINKGRPAEMQLYHVTDAGARAVGVLHRVKMEDRVKP